MMESKRRPIFAGRLSLLVLALALFAGRVQAQNNPIPFVNQPLVPTAAVPGGPAFTLTVNGTGFVSGSVVHWNGRPRPTTPVSGSQLKADIAASDIATPTTGWVTVVNPAPGGGTSNVAYFLVTVPTSAPSFKASSLSIGPYPHAAAEGDFNGDGKLDLAVYTPPPNGSSQGTISILLGNGDGTFTLKTTLSGPYGGGSPLAVGDFNGDGKLDLAALAYYPGSGQPLSTVSIYLGNGDGTFQQPLVSTVGYDAWAMAVGDFNGDGKLDLAVSVLYGSAGGLYVLLGKGDGTFQSSVSYGSNIFGFSAFVAAGDLNGDGNLDLVVGDDGEVAVFLGNGDGTFQAPVTYATSDLGKPTSSVAIADFNGDGKPDLAVGVNLQAGFQASILLGNGDGTFGPYVNVPISSPVTCGVLTAGDFNADDKLDLAAAACGYYPIANADYETPGAVFLLLGNGDGTFGSPQSFTTTNHNPTAVIPGDLKGDGKLDLVVPSNEIVSVLLQIAAGAALLSSTSVDLGNQVVTVTGSPHSVTLKNTGNGPLMLTGISVTGTDSGDFALASSSTCPASGGTLQVGASCNIAVTFTPATWGSRTATLTIADNASNSPQTVDLSGMGQDFSLSLSNSTTGGTITPGGTEGYTVAISPEGGFNQTVTLACSGAPPHSTCSVSPSSVTLDGANSANVTVTVATTAPTMSPGSPKGLPLGGGSLRLLAWWGLVALATLGVVARRKARRTRLVLAAGLLLAVLWASCGGGGGVTHTPGTPKGTYTLTVTGTMTSSSSSAPLTRTINLTLNII